MAAAEHPPAVMLLVRAAERLCAIPIDAVREVMRPLPIQRVAEAPSCVAGVTMLRGIAVPVVELGRLLASATAPAGCLRFVCVQAAGRLIALAVTEVVGVRPIPPTVLAALPPLLAGGHAEAVAALGVRDGELLTVLSAGRLLPDGSPDLALTDIPS